MDPTVNCLSLFSGAAGLDLGVALAFGDVRVIAYVEREAYACEVLASRMEKEDLDPAPIWTDVSTFDGRPFRGLVDIISGGFPCQDISVAGKQAGIGGKRSGLWKQYLRIVDEVRPGLVIIENVSALVTSGLEVVLADLAALGFDAEWGTLRASDVGATHRRDRIFIMAHSHSGGLARVRQSRLREDEQEYGQNSIGGHDAHRRSGASVANAEGDGRGQGWSESDTEGETGAGESGSQHVAYCDDAQREGHTHAQVTRADGSFSYPPCPDDLDRWSAVVAKRPDLEPSVCRVADGLAHRVDRLRLTGNGVVPAQAAHAIRQLLRRILTLIT